MFESAILINNPKTKQRRFTFLISLLLHATVVMTVILVPLLYIHPLPEIPPLLVPISVREVPLPTPSRAGSGNPSAGQVKPKVVKVPPLTVPPYIPSNVEPAPADIPDLSQLVLNENPGITRIPGAFSPGGANKFGDAIPWGTPPTAHAVPPRPPLPQRHAPIRISSGVIAAKLIYRVDPAYPPLAKQARVQGIVVLQVTVDERGSVEEVLSITGHPLLNQAAINAVKQWRYTPTYLNGAPVPVKATVTVNFVLR
ncbi:MAG TPA: energy transducer TonB [Acidobacteriota bacterium]|jgi:protein TonB|nr:energy transducer TonB [Acidobacteriota bacterium]